MYHSFGVGAFKFRVEFQDLRNLNITNETSINENFHSITIQYIVLYYFDDTW